MLSRLNFKNALQLASVPVRIISTSSVNRAWGDRWMPPKTELDKCPPDFKEYPERDIVNFPRHVIPAMPPKVRMGFIPDTWFNAFYYKTGVTGPYVLGVGVATFLLSKEYYVFNGTTYYVMAYASLAYIASMMFRKPAAELLEKQIMTVNKDRFIWRETVEKRLNDQAAEMNDLLKSVETTAPMMFQAQRDIYYLAMEAEYRRRLEEYKKAVKRKLDYFVDLEETKKRCQRRHVVDWVVDQVEKSINDQVQKAALSQCVSNLKMLSQKATI